MKDPFIRRYALAEAADVAYHTTYFWEKNGTLPPATQLTPNVSGWFFSQLPEKFQLLFADADDLRVRQNNARARASQKAARTLAEAGA